MQRQGKLIAQTPLYRGNMRKTLFTRDGDAWRQLNESLGFDATLQERVTVALTDEDALTQVFASAVKPILPRLYLQVDQQVTLVQSDAWIDAEIDTRAQHLKTKTLLLQGKISEEQS